MIKFYDPSGESHFGQATIVRTTSVNGGLSLTGEVFAGDDVLNGLDYGWWLNFDNEKYVITYKKLSDDTNTIVFDAVQQFFWDFAKVALHSQYSGSHEYTFYLNQLFNGSEYTYKNDATVPAFEKENWGYKNKLSLFNDIMDQADVEFEVHNETVHIAKQIGSDLTSFVRKGINLSDLTEEMKISDFATYAKGYGAFKDQQDPSQGRLEVEYRSELAKQFGDLEMDPIVDERYTIADNLIAELKNKIDATYTVSMTMNIYDLENAGYPNYESPKVGDWILAIDEALNFKRKIRIIKLEEQFDVTGKRIGYTATCGDLSIVDQYTNIQSSLDSRVQRIQESVNNVAVSANGKSKNYYGAEEPVSADDGDLWFDQSNSDPDKWSIKQWANGRWEQLTLNPGEVNAKVEVVKTEAETAVNNAKSAADKADLLASKYDDTNSLASQAFEKASSAQIDASSAVVQASAAAADSKDAKQIAGAVSQSYNTLTDGSTMTIAELEGGLATKLTKTDLNGYATQDWSQNQIKLTADGINGTISSIKDTVDGQTTSINDLKADSSSFKSQFTTVNDTLGKQTTDIGTLQASSKELSSNFSSLNSDNTTNKNDISQLKQTATEFSSTLETVQEQVTGGTIGPNLITQSDLDYGYIARDYGGISFNGDAVNASADFHSDKYIATNGETVFTFSSPDYVFKGNAYHTLAMYDSDKKFLGWQSITSPTQTLSKPDAAYIRFSINFASEGGVRGKLSDWLSTHRYKLEKGSVATEYSVVTAVSKISQTIDDIQTTVSEKVDNDTYQSDVLQLSNQIASVVKKGDDNWTAIQQNSSDISLRVEKNGVINAINVSSEGTSIYGDKLHITATTYIDDAIIKSAMIESLEADKIQTGTLDADNVNVIHLNASNITAGVINGPNLAIDLNTGEILFQKGAIRSTNGNLNIDIDSGKMAVTNSEGNGFRFEDGDLYLTDNTWVNSFQSKPDYGSITYKPKFLSNVKGMQITGTEGIAVTTGDYDTYDFLFQHQPASGAALTLHDNTAFLNAREFTRIEGGSTYSISSVPDLDRPTIILGGDNGSALNANATDNYGVYNPQVPNAVGPDLFMQGRDITLQGGSNNALADLNFGSDGKARIFSAAIYNRTYSSGDHVVITGYGTLGRITSARKYKIADTPAVDVISKAKRILDIKPAEWYDKAEMESIADAKTNGTEAPGEAKIEKHYGFIADDFDAAGLTEVVLYKDGEVDSLAYDRIPMYHNVILTDHEKRIAELEAEVKQLKGEI